MAKSNKNTSGYDLYEETPDHSVKPDDYVILFTKKYSDVSDRSITMLADVFNFLPSYTEEALQSLKKGETTITR